MHLVSMGKIYNTDIDSPGNPSDNKAVYRPESNEFTMAVSFHMGQADHQSQLKKSPLSIPGAYFVLGMRRGRYPYERACDRPQ